MSSPKVVTLASRKPAAEPADEDVVRICEQLLEQAKSGKLRSIAACGEIDQQPVVAICNAEDASPVTLLGAVSMLARALQDGVSEWAQR